MKNEIIWRGEGWMRIDISSKAFPVASMMVDTDDACLLINTVLFNGRYPVMWHEGNVRLIHRIILPDYKEVDHINQDKTDNRRCNLRECTRSQNMMNINLVSRNTSGTKGVYLNKKTNKWYAQIGINSTKHCLGTFQSKGEAINARRQAERDHFGEFANGN